MMKKLLRLVLVMLLVTSSAFAQVGAIAGSTGVLTKGFKSGSQANSNDFNFIMRSGLITKIFNIAKKNFEDKDGYIRKHVGSISHDLDIKLSDYADIEDAKEYGKKLLNLNLDGDSKIKFLFNYPFVHGKVKLLDPIFRSSGKKLSVEINASVENYYLYFKNIWVGEQGITNGRELDEDSCQKRIMDGRYNVGDISPEVLEREKKALKKFYGNLRNSDFSKYKKGLWARIDSLSIGYSGNREITNGSNILKIKIIAEVNLKAGNDTLKITKVEHNFGKSKGAKLNIHLPAANIVLPRMYARTSRVAVTKVYDEEAGRDKFVNKYDENGDLVMETSCAPLNFDVAKEYVASLKQDMSKQVYNLVTDEFIQETVDNLNKTIADNKINIPEKLVVSYNEDIANVDKIMSNGKSVSSKLTSLNKTSIDDKAFRSEIRKIAKGSENINSLTKKVDKAITAYLYRENTVERKLDVYGEIYKYRVPKKVTSDLRDDFSDMLGDFTNYRASLGLKNLEAVESGKGLQVGLNADLVIDKGHLNYRENTGNLNFNKDGFKFQRGQDHLGFAISGTMMQNVVNMLRDRLLDTYVPSYLDVKMNNDSVKTELHKKEYYLTFNPKVAIKLNTSLVGVKIKSDLIFVDVKAMARPYIVNKDGRTFLKVRYSIPSGSELYKTVKFSRAVKTTGNVVGVLTFGLGWFLLKDYVVKPQVKKYVIKKLNQYVAQVKANQAEFEITDLVKEHGIKPTYFGFRKTGHAVMYLNVDKLPALDAQMKELKKELDFTKY